MMGKFRRRHLLLVIVLFVLLGAGIMIRRSGRSVAADGRTGSIANETDKDVIVFASFSPSSKVQPADWYFCVSSDAAPLNCTFPLMAHEEKQLPLAGKYLNVTYSFNSNGCPSTEAEMTLNNPGGYDTTDVSLVNGFSNFVEATVRDSSGEHHFGPPKGQTGNEKLEGVYPWACDLCSGSESPPCGFPTDAGGCKAGTQYDPKPPCQYQLPQKGAASIKVALVKPLVLEAGLW